MSVIQKKNGVILFVNNTSIYQYINGHSRKVITFVDTPLGMTYHNRHLFCCLGNGIYDITDGIFISDSDELGYRDGLISQALFDNPTDLIWMGDELIVGESKSGRIRIITDGVVRTLLELPWWFLSII